MEKSEKIVVVKLFNGEFIIGKKGSLDIASGLLSLKDPRSVVIAPSMSGSVQIIIASICTPFKSKKVDELIMVPNTQIMCVIDEEDIDKELINGYLSKISGISIASAADVPPLDDNVNPFI